MKIKLIEPGILGTPMHLLRLVKLSELEQFFADNLTATDAGSWIGSHSKWNHAAGAGRTALIWTAGTVLLDATAAIAPRPLIVQCTVNICPNRCARP